MHCPVCKHENQKDAIFCVACGQRLQAYEDNRNADQEPAKSLELNQDFSFPSFRKYHAPLNFALFFWPVLIGVVLTAVGVYLAEIDNEAYLQNPTPVLFILILGMISLIWGQVYWYIIIYRTWTVIPPDIARVTPGKAVGFLLIPFFNLFWIFVAVWIVTQDIQKTNLRGPFPNQDLALFACIFSVVPYVQIISIVPLAVVAYQFCRFYNANISHIDRIDDAI